MRGERVAGPCPECGTTGAHPGQLVCQGCFVPFALMRPVRDAAGDEDATDALPQVAEDDGRTRVIHLIPGALPRTAQTRRDVPSQALRLRFPGDETVTVEPGVRIRIGRDPRLCPAVRFLASRDNLSRLHATFGVEADGSAWITDEGSTNGTFVHGYRLAPMEPAAVRPGDTVRLAADVTIKVLL
ncbi:FHA domain-containing protein [Actinacidiphila acidipaludis]|uniref:FHA domain-containing protein n=1 Tax=Actinacidiphila acidipaludis TaxID=2873382 RepID=A0ABS7Q6Q8_9ACTN|nr:FHA domain-containing protein [Streptomyces acidipaludis]MBY8878643.1 FHA domain-containing protein [Streptomyces acidipaludis]